MISLTAEALEDLLAKAWDAGFDCAMDDIGAAATMASFGESENPFLGDR